MFRGPRVLIVARQTWPLMGGMERQTDRLARELARTGCDVTLFTATEPDREQRAPYTIVHVSPPGVRFLGTLLWGGALVCWTWRHRRDFDVIHVFQARQSALAAVIAGRLAGVPVVARASGGGVFGEVDTLRRSATGRFILGAVKRADALVALSTDIRREWVSAGMRAERIALIPNGVPVERAPRRGKFRGRVLFVGRLSREKGLDLLLEAWRLVRLRVDAAVLTLVGDGDRRGHLERRSRRLGIERDVRFEGAQRDIPRYLADADIFVLPSISEGMPVALAEAMSAGLAPVATAVSGSRDLIENGANGLLVENRTASALADALAPLLGDPETAREMGRRARETIRAGYTLESVASRHVELYRSLKRKRRRAREPGAGRVRVMHVIATLDRAGAERQMAQLVTHLDRERFQPSVVALTRGGPVEETLARCGVPVKILGKRGRFDPSAFARLVRLMRGERPHVVHTWLFTANSYGRAAALCAGVDAVVAGERSTDIWKGAWHSRLDALLARRTDGVIANAGAVRDAVLARGVPADKVSVIHNGLDVADWRKRARAAVKRRLDLVGLNPLIGYAGRLSGEKGLFRLVRAARKVMEAFPKAGLLLVGDGDDRGKIAALAREAGIAERVRLVGEVEDPAPLIAVMCPLVLASDFEGCPNVILEAMALGVPVVAAAVGGVPEILEGTGAGLLVPPGDEAALARAILEIASDPVLAGRMSQSGRRSAEQRFTLEHMVAQYERTYDELLSPQRGKEGAGES